MLHSLTRICLHFMPAINLYTLYLYACWLTASTHCIVSLWVLLLTFFFNKAAQIQFFLGSLFCEILPLTGGPISWNGRGSGPNIFVRCIVIVRGSTDEPAGRDIALYFPRAPVASTSLSLHLSLILCGEEREGGRERVRHKWEPGSHTHLLEWEQGICRYLKKNTEREKRSWKDQLNRKAMLFCRKKVI